ncbi:uncharacterized protein YegL [Catenulispora sp. EB89]|uniref:vWA domain-containing protein n=1 Tax=Catenulispora sp. EB89 TaxID=3156257 RepID=UPI003519B871
MANKSPLIPFYVVVDVSYSMIGESIGTANRILPEVANALALHPVVNDKIRLSLVSFSDVTKSVVPLCDMSTFVGPLPTLAVEGGTDYGSCFEFLRTQIDKDVSQLKTDNFRVFRPAVFFLSDGEPGDVGWEKKFADLTGYDQESGVGNKNHPIMVPFGVEDANQVTMESLVQPIGKSRCYMMSSGSKAADAIKQMAEILVSSALSSGNTGAFTLPPVSDSGDGGQLTAVGPTDALVIDDDFLN